MTTPKARIRNRCSVSACPAGCSMGKPAAESASAILRPTFGMTANHQYPTHRVLRTMNQMILDHRYDKGLRFMRFGSFVEPPAAAGVPAAFVWRVVAVEGFNLWPSAVVKGLGEFGGLGFVLRANTRNKLRLERKRAAKAPSCWRVMSNMPRRSLRARAGRGAGHWD